MGDYVIYSEWFGLKRTEGRVNYIPGISPLCSDLSDSEKYSLWVFSVPGDFIQMLYASDDKFISKKLSSFVEKMTTIAEYSQINSAKSITAKSIQPKNGEHSKIALIK